MASLLCLVFVVLLFDSVLAQDRTQQRGRKDRPERKPAVEIGDVVKDFELPILDGGKFKLSEKRGTIVVIELGACS
jgi:cytochrome oxidase Cu insertion factor (SCO1/SenC/PrrC family)